MSLQKSAFLKGRAWIELSAANLRHNVDAIEALLPANCELMPVLKADAYGHGAKLVAGELQKMGVRAFCVATALEGVELRKSGIRGEILVLGYTHPEQFYLLRRHSLTQTVVDYPYAQLLNDSGRETRVHIGVDTGMHRLGENVQNLHRIRYMLKMRNLRVEGIFTHLCAADTDSPADRVFTRIQGEKFFQLVHSLQEEGAPRLKAHILGSYGLLHYPDLAGNYARIGIVLYGALSTGADEKRCPVHLRPVLSLKARVASVKELGAGESAGYGRTFTAKGKTKTATLSIGYADGLPRALSRGVGRVLIRGQFAPIIGFICMDQTLVDITGIPDVTSGDEAVIIGESGNKSISAADLAEQTGTITNEIFSRLGPRLERILITPEAEGKLSR